MRVEGIGLLMKCLGESYWVCVLLHMSQPSILGRSPSLPFTPLPIVKLRVKRSNFEYHYPVSGYSEVDVTRVSHMTADRTFA